MKIITLGTSHGATEPGRFCSGNLLIVGDAYYLIDCGAPVEGMMTNMGLPIKNMKAVFITHMHEDHAGTLSAIAKRFLVYQQDTHIHMFLPEQKGIDAFDNWLTTLHLPARGELFADAVKNAQTVVWNGPMGVFENPTLAAGTIAVAKALADSSATTIVGGGDSAAACEQLGFADRITHISTGGGASLEFLEGLELPGIACLQNK